MDTRTLMLYDSMKRIAHVVNAYPALRARAAESTAFEQFTAVIADLEKLQVEQSTVPIELADAGARAKALMEDINLTLECFHATAALIPLGDRFWPHPSLPSTSLLVVQFHPLARAMVEVAAEHAATFIEYGLHPRTFDDARVLLAELAEVDHRRCYLESSFTSFDDRLKIVVDSAKKRRRQLTTDFRRMMTAEMRAAWKQAHSLGRSHRPKALPAPIEQRLLPAPKGDDTPKQSDVPAQEGVKRFTRFARRLRESARGQ